MEGGQSANLQSLKKSAKVLASTGGKIKTLSAPLPQRTAERLDREAAYEQTKEEVDKWKATMQRIKEVNINFVLRAFVELIFLQSGRTPELPSSSRAQEQNIESGARC